MATRQQQQPAHQQIEHMVIQEEHKPTLARMQYVLEDIQRELSRLEIEKQALARRGQQLQNELVAILQRFYGIDAAQGDWSIDVDRGHIIVPHVEPEPEPEPEPAAEPEPAETSELAVTEPIPLAANSRPRR